MYISYGIFEGKLRFLLRNFKLQREKGVGAEVGSFEHINDEDVFICHAEKDFREVMAHWEASCFSIGGTGGTHCLTSSKQPSSDHNWWQEHWESPAERAPAPNSLCRIFICVCIPPLQATGGKRQMWTLVGAGLLSSGIWCGCLPGSC